MTASRKRLMFLLKINENKNINKKREYIKETKIQTDEGDFTPDCKFTKNLIVESKNNLIDFFA